MSVKSMSKKSISIESVKKASHKECCRLRAIERQPCITARHHHKFEFEGVKFEHLLNNLSMSSKRTSLQLTASNKRSLSVEQKNENLKNIESVEDEGNKGNEGAGDTANPLPISIRDETLETRYKSIFKDRTLLILGGTDPYHQHCKKNADLTDKILFYSNRFRRWIQIPHTLFGTRQHHAAVLCNGFVYIIGGTKVIPGCHKTFFETSIWALNIKTKKWSFETNLPKNRRDFAVVAVDDTIHEPGFFVIGGESFDKVPLSSVWFYNISQKVWLRKASLNTARYGFSAAIVKNEIWITGGIAYTPNSELTEKHKDLSSSNFNECITDTIETFRLETSQNRSKGKWIVSKYRLRQRCLFAKLLTTRENKIFLIGGIGGDTKDALHSIDAIDYFDFDAEKWIQYGKLQFARHGHDAVLVDDCIAVIGGVSSKQKRTLQSIEFFCTKSAQIFKTIPDLPQPLSGLAAVLVDKEW